MFERATPSLPLRGIHLDLKGVPPTPRRLIESLGIMAAARVNVVLVEWEDAYPWKSCPEARSETAYTEATVRKFLDEAERLGIEVIPLVQCLGHMETFLAKKRFAGLRERPDVVGELCPSRRESAQFVRMLIDDVMRTHRGRIRRFHLGGDEAWNFGTCPRCKKAAAKEGKGRLYLRHVEPLLDSLEAEGLRPILWDDMMRHWPEEDLRSLAPRAELMAWFYRPQLFGEERFQPALLDKYQRAGIALWGASAFKGADGVAANAPRLDARSANMAAWSGEAHARGMLGVVATGWSRYNTFVLQCESLEASLDALVLAGASMWDGGLAPDAAEQAERMLVSGELAPLAGKKFLACREASRKLDEWCARRDSLTGRSLWEAAAWGEPERHDPFARRCPAIVDGWAGIVKDGLKLTREWVRAHAGLVPKVWLDRYAAARVEPARALAATFVPRHAGEKSGGKRKK